MEITVRATAAVIGLSRGDVCKVEDTPTVDALIDQGFLIWLDAPEVPADPVVTKKVAERKAKKEVADVEGEGAQDAGTPTVVGFLPDPFAQGDPSESDSDSES